MKKQIIKIKKIGSVLKNLTLPGEVEITGNIQSVEGEIIVVKALKPQNKYGEMELFDGKMTKIKKGDIIAGALGQRKALEGIVGIIPKNLKVNDTIHILNLGGVMGIATSWNPDFVDHPLPVQVLGAITQGNSTLNIQDFSLKPAPTLHKSAPIVLILGSSMGVGKTTIVQAVVNLLAKKKNIRVAAGKLTGVAAKRDLLAMKNAGAHPVLSFLDVGLTSTIKNDKVVITTANAVLNELNKANPALIVIELGDGVIGWYGVYALLQNAEFMKSVVFTIGCANDLVGAVGLCKILQEIALKIDFFAGPVTNNMAGTEYLEHVLDIPGQDLRYGNDKLMKVFLKRGILNHA